MIRLPFFHRIQRYIALPIAHPCAFEYCPRRLPVSLPCLCLLFFGSTNNYHRTGTKSTDFFGRSEYFSAGFVCLGNSYSLFTAAQFLRSPASIFILDIFPVCFIMVLCKLNFAWTIKKSAKQPIFAQKQPIFGLQKSRYPIKSGEKDMTLCEKLTQARKAAGLTQADVAAKLNVSRQAVSRWESGQSKPSTEKLLALGALRCVHRPAFEHRKRR